MTLAHGSEGAGGPARIARLAPHIALGRAMRDEAHALVARRGRHAEAAAWLAARAPHLTADERRYREGIAQRVSRMFALIGTGRWH